MDMIQKIAVIDIGSNSVRLQISEIQERKRFRILLEEKDTIRLGEEVFEKGYFGPNSVRKAIQTLKKYKTIIDQQEIEHLRCVATAGFREAANQEELIHLIFQETGIRVDVISGKEEARLIALGVFSNFDLQDKNALIVDIGGGSAELIAGNAKKIHDIKSLSLGCTRLTKFFLKSSPVRQYELSMLEKHLDAVFNKMKKIVDKTPVNVIIGTGGSLNNITQIIYRIFQKNDNGMTREVSLKQVSDLNREVAKRNYKERLLLPGLEKRRVDIVLAAGKVIEKIMKLYKINGFTSLSKGLRDGLTTDTINKLGILFPSQQNHRHIKEQRIREIGHKYFFDERHAENVAKIAFQLFETLKDPLGLEENWKGYLWAAAMLHDIGYHISFSKHHKHSQYLIEHSDLVGFNAHETRIISNIARYHRKSPPKISHKAFRELSILEKDIVNKLAAILRVADAMDRGHLESPHNFETVLEPHFMRIRIKVPEGELILEKEGIEKKGDFFEQIFKRKVTVESSL
jgi:exopolyphosphatase/guanosine-5'-triphosphate,3'-diphosphate pyrophosphatase